MILVALYFFPAVGESQVFYNYLVHASFAAEQYKSYKANKVKTMVAQSYLSNGDLDSSFIIDQKCNWDKFEIIINSKSHFSEYSTTKSTFNSFGKIAEVSEESGYNFSNTKYYYNSNQLLEKMVITTFDSLQKTNFKEEIYLQFDDRKNLRNILQIKNETDSTEIKIIHSSNGLPGEEQWYKKGRRLETWYYYYNDEGYLTDVAKYYVETKKILPSTILFYNDGGEIVKKISVRNGTSEYRTWTIEYNENGLKTKETSTKKNGEMEGFITYNYALDK